MRRSATSVTGWRAWAWRTRSPSSARSRAARCGSATASSTGYRPSTPVRTSRPARGVRTTGWRRRPPERRRPSGSPPARRAGNAWRTSPSPISRTSPNRPMWTMTRTRTGSLAGVLIEHRPATDPELAALLAEQQAELRVLDGVVVGCGGLQRLDETTAEIKRMYVRPPHRRRGISRRMLAALEALAMERGCTVVRLETGSYMPGAIAFYRSAGYEQIPPYGQYAGNPFSVCLERQLVHAG